MYIYILRMFSIENCTHTHIYIYNMYISNMYTYNTHIYMYIYTYTYNGVFLSHGRSPVVFPWFHWTSKAISGMKASPAALSRWTGPETSGFSWFSSSLTWENMENHGNLKRRMVSLPLDMDDMANSHGIFMGDLLGFPMKFGGVHHGFHVEINEHGG